MSGTLLGAMSAGRLIMGLSLVFGLLGVQPAQAQDQWLLNGKPAGSDPSVASSQGFAAKQIATLDAEEFNNRWNRPTPGVEVDSASKVRRNQPIFVFLVFTGCKANATGSCDVTADFKMIDPLGRPWGEQKNSPVWVGQAAPQYGVLQLSTSSLGMVVENKDPLGAYRVIADVTDHVAGITLHTEQVLTAVVGQSNDNDVRRR